MNWREGEERGVRDRGGRVGEQERGGILRRKREREGESDTNTFNMANIVIFLLLDF